MHLFVILCLCAFASAQYHYGPNTAQNPSYETARHGSGGQHPLEYNKEFYSYAAPSQDFNEDLSNEILQVARRNLRVIFIRGPESNSLENAALQLAKAAADDRTAIYVLNKQADISGLAQQLQNIQGHSVHKPEVHFVRYRTESDAQNAQRAIQSQYDTLPGQTTSHGDSAAPVINFASAPSPLQHTSHLQPPLAVESPAAPTNNYLPPGKFL